MRNSRNRFRHKKTPRPAGRAQHASFLRPSSFGGRFGAMFTVCEYSTVYTICQRKNEKSVAFIKKFKSHIKTARLMHPSIRRESAIKAIFVAM